MCLLFEDVKAFERVLLSEFPDMRFLWEDPGRHTDLTKADGSPADGGWPVFGPVPYIESLHRDEIFTTAAWREPPDWQPVWGRREDATNYSILNSPAHKFSYRRGSIQRGRNPRRLDLTYLVPGELWGRYAHEDKEQKRFLHKIMRLLGKVATNKLAVFATDSWIELFPAKPVYIWAGFHAIEWCRKDPRRVLSDFCYRPLEEVETGLPPVPSE